MRPLPTLLLAGCALISAAHADEAAVARSPERARASLDACLLHLGGAGTQSVEQVRKLCPDLESSLQQSDLAMQLPQDWQQRLDHTAVSDLRWLAWRYQPPAPASAPATATLYAVAHALHMHSDRVSFWQGFKNWLRDLLFPASQPGAPWLAGWLSKMSVPSWAARSITYLLLGAALVVAVWIVRREVLAAGVRSGVGRRAARSGPGSASASAGAPLDLASIDAAPLRQQPSMLLQLLVATLARSGRLPDERSLTHRELGVRGVFDDSDQRSRFVRLAQLAEALLYGPGQSTVGAAAPAIELSVSDARLLYSQLSAARGAAR
ncbi:MAG TPA: hypothetical protein VGL28_07500 [Steroidobacteraceae bacterium]